MRFFYSALFYLLIPLILLRMLWRSRRAPEYRRRLAERFGFFAAPANTGSPVIWLHAASVGESQAAQPLIEALIERYPGTRLVVTTTTPTGSARVRAMFGQRVFHVYCPWDLPGAVRRFLLRSRPAVLVLMETELWPNLLHYSQQAGCRVLLANARMSARSARGYSRFGGFTGQMLQNVDLAACQTQADAQRLVELGLPRNRVTVTGSLKFDFDLDSALREQARALRDSLGRPVMLGASTHPGEEALILEAFSAAKAQQPDLLCLLVPRHPERFEEVLRLCRERGYTVARRSTAEQVEFAHDVLLGDTMGELRLFCGVATLCIVGGSFIPHGGQNPLEAAAWGVPLVSGPQMFNFSEITRLLVEAGGMLQLQEAGSLTAAVTDLLADEQRRMKMGQAAGAVVVANRGARDKLLAVLAGLIPGQ